jgi:ABC-type nitrate/sulfonate/bicarbonate transport system substrate-binding protein
MCTSCARLLAIAALVLTCVAPQAAMAQAPVSLTVGCGSTEFDAEAYYAKELGFFQKAGLNVVIQRLRGGPDVQAAVAGGSFQIGDTNVLSLAEAKQRGQSITVIAPGADYTAAAPTSLLVVMPDSPVHSAKDLAGMTVAGISVGGLDQLYIDAWLDKNGGDINSVKFTELPPSAMVPALEAGRIAAASLSEPFLDMNRSKLRVLARDVEALAPNSMITAWFTTSEWAANNPAAVKAFAGAIGEAAVWANKNPEAAAKILAKYMAIEEPRTHAHYAERLVPALVQPILDNAAKYKLLNAPMTYAELTGTK